MSTPTTVKAQIQSLIDTANATTKKQDVTLTDAVGSLVDGYGGSGLDASLFGIPNEVKGTNIVTCDYVNENEHNAEVKLSSDTVTDFSGVEVKCVGNYEPYTEKTYTANADGTVDGVTSISPTMNIICEGVDISVKYYCVPKVEWHRFWDEYQKQGALGNYSNAFSGIQWTEKNFKPKYDIIPKEGGATNIFSGNNIKQDLAEYLDILNIKLDFSNIVKSHYTFYNSHFTRLPLLDMRLCTHLDNSFAYMSYLKIIDELIVNENCIFTDTFIQCKDLRFIKMSGKIGKSINFQWSGLLSVESAKNIIQCLANLVDTNPSTQTITFHDNVWNLLDAEGNAAPNGITWKNYITEIGWNWN